jgi:hypothetical protein
METLGDKNLPKICHKFYCIFCDYGTSKKSSYNDHLLSDKHKKNGLGDVCIQNSAAILPPNEKAFVCKNCNKSYESRNGLWKHKKNCHEKEISNENGLPELTPELILTLIKQNTDFQQLIIEQNKTIIELSKNVGNQNNNVHSNNKSFNLNFFLNETCKDAMNITDFVDSLKLQLSDLEKVGELGYVEGISSIIINNLKELDVTQRPVHCTDKKRETIYIKDEDKWEKDEENKKMHRLVKKVADKNARMLPKFKEKYPEYRKSTSRYSDQYNKILIESMGGSGDNDFEKEEKIIKRVSKEVVVEK